MITDARRRMERLRRGTRPLGVLGVIALASCADRDPLGAGAPAADAPAGLSGIPSLVTREQTSGLSAIRRPVFRASRAVSTKAPQVLIARTPDQTSWTLTFEGPENDAYLRDNVSKVGKGFGDWLALVDTEAGGTGNFANEPSASTVAFWDIDDQDCLSAGDYDDEGMSTAPCATYREIDFDEPVKEVSLYFTSYVEVELIAYDDDGQVVGRATGGPNYGTGSNPPGDAGTYNRFDPLVVSATEEVIEKIRVRGYIQATGIDDLAIVRRNLAPVVQIGGPYATSEGVGITLDGSGSEDPEDEDENLTYSWDLGGGNTATGEKVTVVFADNQVGGYPVSLTVTDQNGKSATASTVVSVSNVAPSLPAVDPIQLAAQQLSASIAFTDPGADSWTATIDYDVNSSSDAIQTVSLTSRSIPLSHTYPASGTYTISVKVDDGDGGVGAASYQAVAGNSPVTIGTVTGATIDEGGTYSSSVSFTDPDAGPWTVTIDWGDGSAPVVSTVTTRTRSLSHVYGDDGSYKATVSVSDGQSTASTGWTVEVKNVAPTATFSAPSTVLEDQALTLAFGSVTDPSPADVSAGFSYAFDCGSGYAAFSTTPSVTCSTAETGNRTVRAKVRDKDGGVREYTKTVSVVEVNLPPVVTASAAASTVRCVNGVGSVKLTGTVSDPNGDPLDVAWYEGTTRRSTELSPTLSLPLGTHTLELRATERGDGGLKGSATVTVAVEDMSVPSVKLSATPGTIWPPNHKYVSVAVSARAEDTCTAGASTSTMVGYVESNEPDETRGKGDGNTTGDIRVIHVHDGDREELSSNSHRRVSIHAGDRLQVRAERAGADEGRVYTIHFTATDAGGTGSATTTVRVDHDRSKGR